ncbi:hypothetical protein IEQ34_020404 [Dendrobium chrysotoxum]|uniref:Uncharacterized protein n=1 Tax=Dendrobium chrysotoxum TaxID=161865 RepID=A0AAV7G0M3_DENCH|nr:hypothetical protein IEQ34_020404 [Dendrobium chrysotoxum]
MFPPQLLYSSHYSSAPSSFVFLLTFELIAFASAAASPSAASFASANLLVLSLHVLAQIGLPLSLISDFPYLTSTPLFSVEVEIGDHISTKNLSAKEDRPVARSEGLKKTHKATKTDDVISIITDYSLITFRKKIHFPNDMVMKVPTRSDRVYEFSLRAGLRFPPSPELIDIFMICGVSLAQLSYRAMPIIMGLIIMERCYLHNAFLRWVILLGRISFRSKWLDIYTRDPSKKKWGKLKELPIPLHIGAEDLLKIFKLSDIDTLHYEIYRQRIFVQGGTIYSSREITCTNAKKVGESSRASKKKKVEEILAVTSKGPYISPSKSHIPEDVLKHQCVCHRRVEELIKYLQGEYKKKYNGKFKEMKAMEEQLAECRAELANMMALTSL